MANKKITELNEATSISNNDWLVMVDVANDETKKIHAGEVGGNIPIQDTAPIGAEENDLWIDTSEENTLKYYDGANWNSVSDNIAGDTLPIGSIVPYGSTTAPANWLVCDGSAISRTTYAELFAIIGTSYGAGDGSTTFNLPNLKGKVAVGQDTSQTEFDTIGETGGSKTKSLGVANLPAHYHTYGYSVKTFYGYGATGVQQVPNVFASGNQTENYVNENGGKSGDGNTSASGTSFNIMNPYQVVCYIIKVKQSSGLIANVSNTYSTSETDTYSCDYINKANNYSTTEQVIGTWISGETIYRKVVELGALPNADTKLVPSGISGQIYPVKVYGIATRSTETFPLPFIWGNTTDPDNYCGLFYDRGNNQFYFRTDRDMSQFMGYAIIEYTKLS